MPRKTRATKAGLTKKSKKTTLLDRLPKNEGERIELMIFFTKRAITDPKSESQQYLLRQLERLENELKEWKKKNKR